MGSTHFRSDIREKGGARTASFTTFQGNLTGDVTGNVTGDVTGDLVGNVSGGDITATNVTVSASVVVGNSASYVKLDRAKAIRLVGNTNWDDLRFPVQNLKINAANSKPDTITPIAGLQLYGFDGGSASEWVSGVAQLPHTWKSRTALHPHVHWMPSTTATGRVCWELQYTVASINSVFNTTVATMLATDYTDGTNYMHRYCSLATIGMTNISASNVSTIILFRLLRRADYSAHDTYGNDAALLEFDIHYEVDSYGSDQETSKTY